MITAKQIKTALIEKGKSQKWLAKEAGFQYGSIRTAISYDRFSVEMEFKIKKALGIK